MMAMIGSALALLVSMLGTQFDFGSHKPPSSDRTLSVSGTAVIYVQPDYATIDVGAFRRGGSAVQTKRDCDQAMAKALAAIRKTGVKAADIETSGYSIFPIRDHDTGPMQWKVLETATVKIRDTAKVATVIDVAVTNGAPQVSNIQFGLESVSVARSKARELAVKMATNKALDLARLTGVQLNGVVSVTEESSDRYATANFNVLRNDVGAGVPDSISAGRQAVGLTVNIVFAIK